MKKKKKLKTAMLLILALVLIAGLAGLGINWIVIGEANKYIAGSDKTEQIDKADCIIVLGALVLKDEQLSQVLMDRMDTAITLYKDGKASKLLLSGDHGRKNYDEVNAMMDYAVSKGVPKEDIFLDHAGFCTYDSMYRARDVFCIHSAIIVTQRFHLSRAVYIARKLGLSAYGVNSDPRIYTKAAIDAFREFFARVKDFLNINIFMPKPKYLGETISLLGDSGVTHDKG